MDKHLPVEENLGSLVCAWTIIKVGLQEKLVYRFNLLMGLIWNFFMVGLVWFLWTSFYRGRAEYNGVSVNQTLTYIIVGTICWGIFPEWCIHQVNRRLRTGNIIFDITRPLYYGQYLLYETMGQTVAWFLTFFLPTFIGACLLLKINLPGSVLVWLTFFCSLVLAYLIAFFIDYLLSLLGFWITEMDGIYLAKLAVIPLLTGTAIPLWIFPSNVERILLFLPFRGMNYTPLAILIGRIPLSQAPQELMIQLLWVLILAAMSQLIFHLGVRKLSIQGG